MVQLIMSFDNSLTSILRFNSLATALHIEYISLSVDEVHVIEDQDDLAPINLPFT